MNTDKRRPSRYRRVSKGATKQSGGFLRSAAAVHVFCCRIFVSHKSLLLRFRRIPPPPKEKKKTGALAPKKRSKNILKKRERNTIVLVKGKVPLPAHFAFDQRIVSECFCLYSCDTLPCSQQVIWLTTERLELILYDSRQHLSPSSQ